MGTPRGLVEQVREQIRRERLISEGQRVVVALSGGGDSVALTLLLREIAAEGGFVVAGIAHLNHQLRDDASDDLWFCSEFARRLSLPIETEAVDVRTFARELGVSLEEAGHRVRYRFFEDVRTRLGADCVATAHTQDDQAETVLMRLLRGAGPTGLAGIHPRRGQVVRPLLAVSKAALRSYLSDRGQTYQEDETNRDRRVTRNRIRHELIPLLERRFSPAVVETLAREAQIARHDAAWLDAAANAAWTNCVVTKKGVVTINSQALAAQPAAIGRRVTKLAIERVSGGMAGYEPVERVFSMAIDQTRQTDADLPGCRVTFQKQQMTLRAPSARWRPAGNGFAYHWPVPGAVSVPEAGLVLSAERESGVWSTAKMRTMCEGGRVASVNGELISNGLIVRSWRNGDVLRPLGLGGRKKLQDLFVDRKVVRSARGKIPVVTDSRDEIVWVVGHAIAEEYRVTPSSKGMLILKARSLNKVGGAG